MLSWLTFKKEKKKTPKSFKTLLWLWNSVTVTKTGTNLVKISTEVTNGVELKYLASTGFTNGETNSLTEGQTFIMTQTHTSCHVSQGMTTEGASHQIAFNVWKSFFKYKVSWVKITNFTLFKLQLNLPRQTRYMSQHSTLRLTVLSM